MTIYDLKEDERILWILESRQSPHAHTWWREGEVILNLLEVAAIEAMTPMIRFRRPGDYVRLDR